MHKFLQRAPRWVAWAAYVCFACRIFVPAGYMPAPLSEGGPFVLCPGGYQAELLQYLGAGNGAHGAHASHHGADGDEQGSHEAWTHCPIGASFSSVALASSVPALQLDSLPSDPPVATAKMPHAVAPLPRAQIRAPPTSLSS